MKKLVAVFVFLLMLAIIMPASASCQKTVPIPTNHLEMVIHTSEPPGTYYYGDTIYISFSEHNFTLSDCYGSFEGTYTYRALDGDRELVLDFTDLYPDFEIILHPDSTFSSSEYDPELSRTFHDSGTYEWK